MELIDQKPPVHIERLPDGEALLTITIPPQRVQAAWKRSTNLFTREARVPGFRPGKAPRSIIESKYAKLIREHLIETLTEECIESAKNTDGVSLMASPDVESADLSPDGSFRCTLRCILAPEFELPDLSQIRLQVPEIPVTDQHIEQELEELRKTFAEFPPIEGRGPQTGDFAVISYEASLDGTPLKSIVPEAPALIAGRQNFWLQLGEKKFLQGFDEAILSMSIGETRKIQVPLPDHESLTALNGKPLEYTITLEGLHSRVLPPLDDRLAEQIVPGNTLEQLREKIRRKQQVEASVRQAEIKAAKLADWLVNAVDFEPPAKAVNQEFERSMRKMSEELADLGVDQQKIAETLEKQAHESHLSSAKRVKLRLILNAIATKTKPQVSEQDVLEGIQSHARAWGVPFETLLKKIRKNQRHLLYPIFYNIVIRKTFASLLDAAVVEIVPAAPETTQPS